MFLIDYVVTGITTGSIIALGAIGLTLTFGILKFPNISHGDLLAVSAYIGFAGGRLFNNIYLAVMGAIVGGALIAFGVEKVVWRPMREKGASLVAMLIASIGVAIALRHMLMAIAGSRLYFQDISPRIFYLGDIRISSLQVIIVLTAVATMLLLHFVLQKTKLGKSMRAISDEPALAKVSGIDVNRVIGAIWIIGGGMAGLAGFLFTLQTSLRPDMGFHLLFPMFVAVILGGIGNPYGAMIGGLTLGLAQDLSLIFLPSQYKIIVGFVVMILVLIYKPTGIMGRAN